MHERVHHVKQTGPELRNFLKPDKYMVRGQKGHLKLVHARAMAHSRPTGESKQGAQEKSTADWKDCSNADRKRLETILKPLNTLEEITKRERQALLHLFILLSRIAFILCFAPLFHFLRLSLCLPS